MSTDLETLFPMIPWREPLRITRTDGAGGGFACRLCIALHGITADVVPFLPDDPQTVLDHIAHAHPPRR